MWISFEFQVAVLLRSAMECCYYVVSLRNAAAQFYFAKLLPRSLRSATVAHWQCAVKCYRAVLLLSAAVQGY